MKTLRLFGNFIAYYKQCFELVDCFHFNSEVSEIVYKKNLGPINGETIPISNCNISDNRTVKEFSSNGLVVGFIGNATPYKGLQILLNCINGLNVDLKVWGGQKKEDGRIHYCGKYSSTQLASVYKEMDVLVVPSIWKETFSLVTLEAISYGTPVIVSDNVGAQTIVKVYNASFVYHSEKELRLLLEELVNDKSKLIAYNNSILSQNWKHDMMTHAQEIIEEIYKI